LVEAWTTWHLHNGRNPNAEEEKRYRADLRERIARLTAGPSLHATYICRRWPLKADVENLLFYNVRMRQQDFGDRRFLSFERRVADELPACGSITNARAYIRYEVGEHSADPVSGSMIAECEPISCEKRDFNDPGRLWKLSKEAIWRSSKTAWFGGEFKAELVMSGPKPLNIVGLVKKVLDGFLSALHYRREADFDFKELVDRLANKYRWDRNEVHGLLIQQAHAVLGHFHVPRCYRRDCADSLMWSPRDDLLTFCRIVHEVSDGPDWKLRGRLFL
jgi:hypothetical protein